MALGKTNFIEYHTRHSIALGEECFCREPNIWQKTGSRQSVVSPLTLLSVFEALSIVCFVECFRGIIDCLRDSAKVVGFSSGRKYIIYMSIMN